MSKHIKILVRFKDSPGQSWDSLRGVHFSIVDLEELVPEIVSLAYWHEEEFGIWPIEARWNYPDSFQGHYFVPVRPDPIVDIEIRLPWRGTDVITYRHHGPESTIESAIEYYIKTHNADYGLSITRVLWRHKDSQNYQIYPKE